MLVDVVLSCVVGCLRCVPFVVRRYGFVVWCIVFLVRAFRVCRLFVGRRELLVGVRCLLFVVCSLRFVLLCVPLLVVC